MSASHGVAIDLVGPAAPQRERSFRIPGVQRAFRAPQREHRTADFTPGIAISLVMPAVEIDGGTVFLADRVGVGRIA